MKRIIVLVILSLFLFGCFAQSISSIKKEENIGKTVVVKGIVENPIKIGKLSGYTLRDSYGDTISVSSQELPAEGKTISVKGTLMKEGILGYYIQTSN